MNVRPLDSEKQRSLRVLAKAVLDVAFGNTVTEPTPKDMDAMLRRVK